MLPIEESRVEVRRAKKEGPKIQENAAMFYTC